MCVYIILYIYIQYACTFLCQLFVGDDSEAVVEAVSGSLASVSPAKLEAALILERSQTQRRLGWGQTGAHSRGM